MDVKIVKVSGNTHAEREVKKHEKKGYTLQQLDTRKAVWSPLTGFLTRKQIHTLTFVK
jgi:hypothetical protein